MELKRTSPAYFSILRWRKDPLRDEARNVAIVLVDVEGESGFLKAAPISAISSKLQEQGFLDQLILGLDNQVHEAGGFTLQSLKKLHASLQNSIVLSEPKPAVISAGDPETVISALYRAYVAPDVGGSQVLTKGKVLDKVVTALRKFNKNVKRGEYIKDYLFDVVLDSEKQPKVFEVLSFATSAKNWIPTEHDAGYFLHAIDRLNKVGFAVIQPPTHVSDRKATESHERVIRMFKTEHIPSITPSELVSKLKRDPQLDMIAPR